MLNKISSEVALDETGLAGRQQVAGAITGHRESMPNGILMMIRANGW